MTDDPLIARTADFVRSTLDGDSSGHDWHHIARVWRNAISIGKAEGANLRIIEFAALLHDIADWKFHGGDETAGPRAARSWLEAQQVAEPEIAHVCEIIASLSYKGAGVKTPMRTLEGECVQDADRLDAIGAIGIARAFAYGGHAGRAMHDPDVPPIAHDSFAAYKKNDGPTINHFYEKLLLLKDRMNTETAKSLAAARHTYMQQFLDEFLAEWNGDR